MHCSMGAGVLHCIVHTRQAATSLYAVYGQERSLVMHGPCCWITRRQTMRGRLGCRPGLHVLRRHAPACCQIGIGESSVGEQGLLVPQPMLLDVDEADADRQAGMQAR